MSTGGDVTIVDTSCWIEAMRERGDSAIRERVGELIESGRARFTDIVRLELANGLASAGQRRFLRELEDLVETVPATPAVWSAARALAERSRGGGVTVPATDLLVFAAARVHGLALLHRDAHFDQLTSLA